MRYTLVLIGVLLASFVAYGFRPQEAAEGARDKTRLEALSGVRGEVVVRGFTTMGKVKGKYGGEVSVDVKEFTAASTGKRESGITVEVETGEKYSRSAKAFVDMDEIDSLITGLDYIARLKRDVTKLDDFQADFQTKGDLLLSTASSGDSIIFAIRCGSIGGEQLLFGEESIASFRRLLVDSKAKLDSLGK